MTRVFIYCPRSGDRVFAVQEHGAILVLLHPNGCRTVHGGCHLRWSASDSGSWWRDTARRMAMILVQAHGGLAWDDLGVIHIIVPEDRAWASAKLMDAARGAVDLGRCERDDVINEAALLLFGAASLGLDGRVHHRWQPEPPPSWGWESAYFARRVSAFPGDVEVVAVAGKWGVPEVTSGPLPGMRPLPDSNMANAAGQ